MTDDLGRHRAWRRFRSLKQAWYGDMAKWKSSFGGGGGGCS